MFQLADKIKHCVLRIKRGKKEAFSELYDLTFPKMMFYAKSYLIDKQEAEDIVNEAYIKFCKNIENIDVEKNTMNWLIKVTKNTALNYNRRMREIPCDYIESHNNDIQFIELEEKIILKNSILDLDEYNKNLFYLYYVEERTIRDIGKILNKSKTVVWKEIKALSEGIKKRLRQGDNGSFGV